MCSKSVLILFYLLRILIKDCTIIYEILLPKYSCLFIMMIWSVYKFPCFFNTAYHSYILGSFIPMSFYSFRQVETAISQDKTICTHLTMSHNLRDKIILHSLICYLLGFDSSKIQITIVFGAIYHQLTLYHSSI